MQIIEARPQNYADIQHIAYQTWPHTFKDILSPEQIAYMLEMMYSLDSLAEQASQKGHIFLLVAEGNGFLGFASYECNYLQLPSAKIHKIYVMPSAQGKGIGKLLINEIAKMAGNNGNSSLILNVNKYNPAIRFYEKMGFRKTGEECIPIGNGFVMDDIIMEYQIKKGFQSKTENP